MLKKCQSSSLTFVNNAEKAASTFLGNPFNKYDIDEISVAKPISSSSVDKLAALVSSIPKSQRSKNVQDQYVRDKQGRKRFHGAFTGGFSAGYFNTVDTPEGWEPKSYLSSVRNKRDPSSFQKVEDYMDEEDWESMPSNSNVISVTNAIRQENYFEQLLGHASGGQISQDFISAAPLGNTWGHQLLRKLGWREKAPVMASLCCQKPEKMVSQNSTGKQSNLQGRRKIGPQIIIAPFRNPQSSAVSMVDKETPLALSESGFTKAVAENFEDFWDNAKWETFDILLKASSNLEKLEKSGYHGLGCPKEREILNKGGSKRQKRNQGFGVGVLNEDDIDFWDDIYGDEEDFRNANLKESSAMNQKLEWLSKNDYAHVEFVNESKATCVEKSISDRMTEYRNYICKSLRVTEPPPHWRGYHEPNKEELCLFETNDSHTVRECVEFLIKNNLLKNKGLVPGSELSEKKDRDERNSGNKALWNSVSLETRRKLIESLGSSRKFVASISVETDKTGETPPFAKESEESGSKTSLNTSKKYTDPTLAKEQSGKKSPDELPCRRVGETNTQSLAKDKQRKTSVRSIYYWKPELLLCQLLNTASPWGSGKTFIDNNPENTLEWKKQKIPTSLDFVNDIATLAGCNPSVKSFKGTSAPVSNEISEQVSLDAETIHCIVERPSKGIFKKIFGESNF